MKSMQFKITDNNGKKIICDVIATYHDDETNKDYIIYTDRTYDKNNKLNVYYSLYKKNKDDIELINITDSRDKKVALELIKELINDINPK
jgi:uncharacterized protein YrzB (UPF0473 family)